MGVLYVVEQTPLRLEDTIPLTIYYPVRNIMVVLTYQDHHLAGLILNKAERAQLTIEHNYTGGLSIACTFWLIQTATQGSIRIDHTCAAQTIHTVNSELSFGLGT